MGLAPPSFCSQAYATVRESGTTACIFHSQTLPPPPTADPPLTSLSSTCVGTSHPRLRFLTRARAPLQVCDPVDGTANFLHGLAWTCVSIALVVKAQPVVGVVYNPVSEELFTAVKGQGAFLNESQRLQPSSVTELTNACICTEFGANRDPEVVKRKVPSYRPTRALGPVRY